jgi:serine/threonine-protein kinase
VTGSADIYSLGCVVFECVHGQPPFADREGMRVLWAHLQDEPPDPSAGRTDISSEFAHALKAALRKEPAQRPRTTIEYARSLAEAAGIPIADAAS